MGKSAGSAPQAPDPEKVIPLQGQENRNTFDYVTQQSRVNEFTPTGSVTWNRTPVFDEAGYNAAMKAFNQGQSQPQAKGTKGNQTWVSAGDETGNGYWMNTPGFEDSTAVSAPGVAPSKDLFTTYDWAKTTALSPEQQKLYDANTQSQLTQSQLLQAMTERLGGTMGQPLDYSQFGDPQGVNAAQLGTERAAIPGMTQVSGGQNLQQIDQGQINRGDLLGMSGDIAQRLGGYEARIGELDPLAFNREAADAVYSQGTRYLDEQTKQQQQALEARLAEQGFVPGTPGYQRAMQNFQDTNARAYADARDRATIQGTQVGRDAFGSQLGGIQAQIAAALGGGQFQAGVQGQDFAQQANLADRTRQGGLDANAIAQQLFQNEVGAAGFNNAASQQTFENTNRNLDALNATRAQQQGLDTQAAGFNNQNRAGQIAEMLQQRSQPLNELNALRSGTQVNMPTGTGQAQVPGMNPVDVMGAYNNQYQGQIDAYNAGVGSDNSLMGSIAGLLGAGMQSPELLSLLFGSSDVRLKENLEFVGKTPGGNNVYEYDIFGRREQGVLAQELKETQPDAVVEDESGYLLVDYAKVK